MGSESSGAYGFRLVLPAYEAELPDLLPVDGETVTVTLECRHATALVERNLLEPGLVSFAQPRHSSLEVRRDPATITLEFPETTTPEALVHPLLTPPIAILSRWRGDMTLHAGSFFASDRAWGVVGEREAGKSTTLAKLAQRGCPLLADDLLVLDGDRVRCGPACIDLRPDVAERIAGARFLGEIGGRPRYRLAAPHGPTRAPLGGFFLLAWSERDSLEIERVPPHEALRIVYAQEYIGLLGAAAPEKILDLLGVPMWRVRRPRDWGTTGAAIDGILDIASSHGG